jgi:hypothetical protein
MAELQFSPVADAGPSRGHDGGTLPRRIILSGASGALISVLVLPSAARASSPGGTDPTSDGFAVTVDDDRADGTVVVSFYEG